jgi:hypothetical protein
MTINDKIKRLQDDYTNSMKQVRLSDFLRKSFFIGGLIATISGGVLSYLDRNGAYSIFDKGTTPETVYGIPLAMFTGILLATIGIQTISIGHFIINKNYKTEKSNAGALEEQINKLKVDYMQLPHNKT